MAERICRLALVFLLSGLAPVLVPATVRGGEQPRLANVDISIKVDERGDAAIEARMAFSSPRSLQRAKDLHPDAGNLLHFAFEPATATRVRDGAVRYDSSTRAVISSFTLPGLAVVGDGKWLLPLGVDAEAVISSAGKVVLYHTVPSPPNVVKAIGIVVQLPGGATEIGYDRERRELHYRTPIMPLAAADEAGEEALAVSMRAATALCFFNVPPLRGLAAAPDDALDAQGASPAPVRPPAAIGASGQSLGGASAEANPCAGGAWLLNTSGIETGGGHLLEVTLPGPGADGGGHIRFVESGDVIPLTLVENSGGILKVEAEYPTHIDRRRITAKGTVEEGIWKGELQIATTGGKRIAMGSFVSSCRPPPSPEGAAAATVANSPADAGTDAGSAARAGAAVSLSRARPNGPVNEGSPVGMWRGSYDVDGVSYRLTLDVTDRGGELGGIVRLVDEDLEGSVTDVWFEEGRVRLAAYIKNHSPGGGRLLVVAMDGAINGGRWEGLFAAGEHGADEPEMVCGFRLERSIASPPRRLSRQVEAPPAAPGGGPGEARGGMGGMWSGAYGLTGDEQRVIFDIKDGASPAGRVSMPDDKIEADIEALRVADETVILSASWKADESGKRARVVFSGLRDAESWRGEVAVYIDGVPQSVFTGKFRAEREKR